MVYREIIEGDNPNKGRYKGACNRRACMSTDDVEFYHFGTGSYYCGTCAFQLNKANPDSQKVYGTEKVCMNIVPSCVVDNPASQFGQTIEDLECLPPKMNPNIGMTDEDFLGYCRLHCRTPRGMFVGFQIKYLCELAGEDEWAKSWEGYEKVLGCFGEGAVDPLVKKARERLKL